jgi:hypothetical protein
MTNQKPRNTFLIDYDDNYIPIVKTASGQIQINAGFSLAEQSARSGERLERLVDFIRCHNAAPSNHNGQSVGISHRLVAQFVYLAYWENYPLEFRIEGGATTVVLARFTRQSQLTVALDFFKDGLDPYSEIQGWWNFFCETISDHAEIWHIPLIVDESVYRKLTPGDFPLVQMDIVSER